MNHETERIDQIWADIRLLDLVQRRLLLEQLEDLVLNESGSTNVSVLSLQGLGHDIWEGMDARVYVRQERNSCPS